VRWKRRSKSPSVSNGSAGAVMLTASANTVTTGTALAAAVAGRRCFQAVDMT